MYINIYVNLYRISKEEDNNELICEQTQLPEKIIDLSHGYQV
jgi:hypothetical protein